MKVRQHKGAFQITESSFDPPAFVLQHTQQRRRETGFGKVCDYSAVAYLNEIRHSRGLSLLQPIQICGTCRWHSAFPDTIALCRIAVQMPPQPPLPESRSRECRHSSSYRRASPAASTSASRPTAKVNAILAKQSALEKKLQEQEETKS